jgi:NAD-dependent deacetylase
MSTPIEQARRLAVKAKRPVFFSGAGMSADSGVPTFRDALTGLWARYDPTELATGEAFERDPELVWNFYEYRRGIVRKCAPNAGHRALAAFEGNGRRVTVVTQNVDGYHQLAGSSEVLCLHGNIMEDRCHRGCPGAFPASELESPTATVPPACPACGHRTMRPNVVWFGEALDEELLERARDAVRNCDLMVVIGTSGVVYPAAGLADLALGLGKRFVEINPEPTPWSVAADVALRARASEILPRLLAAKD